MILGYFSAIFVGLTLGMIGAGGSILILPILVYLMGVAPASATAYSLFIVGTTSIFGFLNYKKQNLVDIKTGLIFALPAFLGVFLARAYILPAVPELIFDTITKDSFILIFFAVIMLLASISMIRGRNDVAEKQEEQSLSYNFPLIGLEGLIVGGITGFVGAGGGFLIIPALVVLAKLPMKKAIGTSLMIISIKSLFGLLGDFRSFGQYDWKLLLLFTILSVVGIVIGSYLGKKVSGKKLKPAFGYFVVVMAIYIIGKEILSIN
jgi:uncharacterized membrane protein YfcA